MQPRFSSSSIKNKSKWLSYTIVIPSGYCIHCSVMKPESTGSSFNAGSSEQVSKHKLVIRTLSGFFKTFSKWGYSQIPFSSSNPLSYVLLPATPCSPSRIFVRRAIIAPSPCVSCSCPLDSISHRANSCLNKVPCPKNGGMGKLSQQSHASNNSTCEFSSLE